MCIYVDVFWQVGFWYFTNFDLKWLPWSWDPNFNSSAANALFPSKSTPNILSRVSPDRSFVRNESFRLFSIVSAAK